VTAVLPGPLDVPPPVTSTEADAMLDAVLADIVLGAWDREVLSFLRQSHPGEQATIASWCRRSWSVGVQVGRSELAEEVAGYHEAMAVARAALDRSERRASDGP